MRYGFRSFDRQWIIPDNRVINQPNPNLWRAHSDTQVYLTALHRIVTIRPALRLPSLRCIPDYDHYKGSFGGRVFPLWRDAVATVPNLPPNLLPSWRRRTSSHVTAEDFLAYLAGVAANPAYTARFQKDLVQPGLRIPITARPSCSVRRPSWAGG